MQCLFPQIPPETLALNLDLAPYAVANRGRHRLAGSIMGLIGILILFPFCATLIASVSGQPHAEPTGTRPPYSLSLAAAAVAALASVLLLSVGIPLKFLHMYSADYLLSLLLIVGAALLILNRRYIKENWPPNVGSLAVAAVLGFSVFLAVSGWLNWQLDDAWLNGPRWIRFAAILPLTFIFCGAEELGLGPVQQWQAPCDAIWSIPTPPTRNLSRVYARLLQADERAGPDSLALRISSGILNSATARCRRIAQANGLRFRDNIV